tara:strand:- start:1422 stop:1631 length:210 start_codon:yes stop_codon:yes gene_type:complete
MLKLTTLLILLPCTYAHAYIGPGLGIGIIASTLGVVVAIFAAIFGILWFPLKRYLNKKKEIKNKKNNPE